MTVTTSIYDFHIFSREIEWIDWFNSAAFKTNSVIHKDIITDMSDAINDLDAVIKILLDFMLYIA